MAHASILKAPWRARLEFTTLAVLGSRGHVASKAVMVVTREFVAS